MDPGWSLEGTCLPMTVTTNVKEFHVQFNGLSSCFAASMSVSCIYILYVYVYIYIYMCVCYISEEFNLNKDGIPPCGAVANCL